MQKCISIAQAGAALNLSRTSIYKLLDTGQLRSLKTCGRRLIPLAELERFIAERLADALPGEAA